MREWVDGRSYSAKRQLNSTDLSVISAEDFVFACRLAEVAMKQ
jgi:hypothetical protein